MTAPNVEIPPQSIEAEQSVLGAMLTWAPALEAVVSKVRLEPEDFYLDRHRLIYRHACKLYGEGSPVDEILLADALGAELAEAGGRDYLAELASSVPAAANAGHHAAIVLECALDRAADEALQARKRGELTIGQARERLAALEARRGSHTGALDRLIGGGAYILDAADAGRAVWGRDDQVLWPAGEPLLICAPQGVGKTTITQQLCLARAGIADPRLLGLPVEPDPRPVLYLAMDRAEQARRSLARMVTDRDRERLDERFLVWRGPLPFDIVSEPYRLAEWARSIGAGTLAIDSLKDAAVGLSEDAVGAAVNQAHQGVVAAGIELVVCHHQRKSQDGRKPNHLDDVYGSTWITAGAGSVVLLWGQPGDAYVELTHLKQPVDEVGPLSIHHDHVRGRSTVPEPVDLLELAKGSPLTVADAARHIYETDSPDRNQVERARRRLEKLAADGKLDRHDPGNKQPVSYRCRVIGRDTPRDQSRTPSRSITQSEESAFQSITQDITPDHAAPGDGPPPSLEGRPRPRERDLEVSTAAPPCRYPDHRGHEWTGAGGKVICGVCSPKVGGAP